MIKDYALSTYALFDQPLREAIDRMVAQGYREIEIMCEGRHAELLSWSEEQLGGLIQLSQEKGVRWSIHAPISGCNPAAEAGGKREQTEKTMRRCLQIAGQLACTHVVMHVGEVANHLDILSRQQGVARVIRFLQDLADDVEAAQVRLLLENVPPYPGVLGCNLDEITAICRELDSPLIGIVYDVGHAHLVRPGYVLEALEEAIPYLHALHLSDNAGEHDDHLAVGEGTIPFIEVEKRSRQHRFTGTRVLEMTSMEDARLSLSRLDGQRKREANLT